MALNKLRSHYFLTASVAGSRTFTKKKLLMFTKTCSYLQYYDLSEIGRTLILYIFYNGCFQK